MNSLFEKTNINTSRQIELDIARGLAVLFMITVHVLGEFSNEQVTSSLFGAIVEFLGSPPAAPVFMFLLGAGIVYSKKSTPALLFKRGVIILLGGYILNFLRGTLPSLIAYALEGNNEFLALSVTEFISVDILQFAGLALIYFAIVQKLKLNLKGILITGFVFCFINLFATMKIDNLLFATFCSLFWGANELSYFPFLTWIAYPIFGYCFGTFLIRCKDKSKFYSILLAVGLLSLVGFGFIFTEFFGFDLGMTDDYAYYHHDIFGNIILLSFILIWISLLFFASKGFVGVLKSTVQRWSKNVTKIYFIHWILIGFLYFLIAPESCGLIATIIISIILAVVSDALAEVTRKKLESKASKL